MSTLFIAVQCFQCSTMQVKQQKKSSNKWVCVVCNEKQSLRRIHARGYLAKDVRKFVQGFNSSRSVHGSDGPGWVSPRSEGFNGGLEVDERGTDSREGNRAKRRMDWTEYLDPKVVKGEEEEEEDEQGDGHSGPNITTELPPEMFGRPFPKYPRKLNKNGEGSGLLKPNFSNKRHSQTRQGNVRSMKCQRTAIQKEPSKWSKYMEGGGGEEELELKFEGDGSNSQLISDLRVEEEVHPDFM